MTVGIRGIVIFDNGVTQARLIKCSANSNADKLVVTFDPMFLIDVEKPAFGELFLLSLGCDVVSVQKRQDLWYQDVDIIGFARLIEGVGSYYGDVFAYGSSMGAYMALCVARFCRMKTLAISPCCYIHPRFPSHLARAKGRVTLFRHGAFVPAPDVTGLVIYDPQDGCDREYIKVEVMPNFRGLDYMPLHFSGHSSVEFLHEIGALKSVLIGFLNNDCHTVRLSGRKGISKKYLYAFARRCAVRGRLKCAIQLMHRAVEISPSTPDFRDFLNKLYLQQSANSESGRLTIES